MLIINIAGIALIALIIWWFWLYRPAEAAAAEGSLTVVVADGTYQPVRIRLPANEPGHLRFLRRDPSPCAETLLFPDLEISESLPLDAAMDITLPPLQPGTYPFHCQMQMYRGELHVVAP